MHNNLASASEQAATNMQHLKTAVSTLSQGFVGILQGLSSLGSSLMILKGAWDTLQDPNISGFEKAIRVTASLSMGLTMLITSL